MDSREKLKRFLKEEIRGYIGTLSEDHPYVLGRGESVTVGELEEAFEDVFNEEL